MNKKIKELLTLKRVTATATLIVLVMVSASFPLVGAQTVTQGYSSDKKLQRGTIVALDGEDTSKVTPVNWENEDRIHGIVVASNDATFTLSDESEKTFVATVGRFDALVSTEAGPIQPGDFLTVSSISGIAKKAAEFDKYTVGKAIEGFDGTDNKVSETDVRDISGTINRIAIGRVLIDIGVGSNPLLKPVESNLPGFLQRATEAIAGKQVSPVRVYVGLIILFLSGILAGALLYSGIRSSVISIGRNPLSKKSVTKSMLQIIITSIIIFMIGIFAVYLLLRL